MKKQFKVSFVGCMCECGSDAYHVSGLEDIEELLNSNLELDITVNNIEELKQQKEVLDQERKKMSDDWLESVLGDKVLGDER